MSRDGESVAEKRCCEDKVEDRMTKALYQPGLGSWHGPLDTLPAIPSSENRHSESQNTTGPVVA